MSLTYLRDSDGASYYSKKRVSKLDEKGFKRAYIPLNANAGTIENYVH